MSEFFTWVVIVTLAVFGIGYLVTTWYRRTVATGRSERWGSRLRHLSQNLPLPDEAGFTLRHGEKYVITLKDQMLMETRRAPRVSSRKTDAFTVALAKGFYYTAAAGSSVSPEPGDEIRQIDVGKVTFTTHRVVFVGSKHTREWDFAKMLGISEEPGGLQIMIAVSNRQRMSGLASQSFADIPPGLAFQITDIAREEGFESARRACANALKEIEYQMQVMNESFFISADKIEKRMVSWRERNLPKPGTEIKDVPPEEPLEPLQEIEVVGETFYKRSFDALRDELESDGDSEHEVEAELRQDPDNKYSQSGKAVAVFINSHKVGHVPEWLAPKVFDALEPLGGSITLPARLYLDDEGGGRQRNSVTVFMGDRLSIR